MTVRVDLDHCPVLGPVRDQDVRNTCLAHATTTAHEFSRQSTVSLSPEFLHFFATGGNPSSAATFPATADALETKGQPSEAECPYVPSGPPTHWRPPRGVPVFRRASEFQNADFDEIENSLQNGRLPILGLSLPRPFFLPTPPWVISAKGSIHCLHAVVGVGLGANKGKRAVFIRNSWGSDWGSSGHAWLNEEFVSTHLKVLKVLTNEVT